jgi:hypothetical protein
MLVPTEVLVKIRVPSDTVHGATWNFADFHPEENGSRYKKAYVTLVIKHFHLFTLCFLEYNSK